MLDANLSTQLQGYLTKIVHPIELVAALDDSAGSRELIRLLREIESLSDKVSVVAGDDARRPSFLIRRVGTEVAVRFAGIPLGHEFTSLVLALLQVGGHPSKLAQDVIAQIAALEGPLAFETYFSLSCQNCPDVVQALNLISVLNTQISHVAIEGGMFQDEVAARGIMSVPTIFLNGQPFGQGRMTVEQVLTKLDTGHQGKVAAGIAAKDPFDVLVVGGGPAGAAAAIYAARKGIRTGIVAERVGGQVLDTMAIENFVSVTQTEGPRLAADLERHVAEYGIDVLNLQRGVELTPAAQPGGLHELRLESGASLKARSVILATGARWRQMNVPGEEAYRNKGVTYCPHCDGPLFKGKRVAVIGGGNSGVEAAIDLAGVVAHVTLVEYAADLRADAVLQRKLASLPNVKVITSTMTTEVNGDGTRVTGLTYKDRNHDAVHRIELEGIFVQIGLVPNTEWLGEAVALTPQGEIEVDHRGETSVPGIFGAGDVTTVPFKQIVIAMGEGSKASLSAFDYLIRLPLEASGNAQEALLAA
jgi:alkyl hydroperoxide reductase subunit F